MESHGSPGRIQVSSRTYELLRDDFRFEPRGEIEIKGKGPMRTYYLLEET
jgi:class 3 adenylate cyclase